jgi:hypothetical protein
VILQNLTTGTSIPASRLSAAFNAKSNEVTLKFPGYTGGALPDGNYRATFSAGSVTDTAGVPLAGDGTLEFFVFAGDADHDRTIGPADFNLLARYFGSPAVATLRYADFDYDGVIGPSDFNLLASRFGTTLPAPAPVSHDPPGSSKGDSPAAGQGVPEAAKSPKRVLPRRGMASAASSSIEAGRTRPRIG